MARMIPTAADRDARAQAESRDASRLAMEQMADGVREGLQKISDVQAAIEQRLSEQGKALAKIATELHGLQAANEELEARLGRMESQMSWLWFGLCVMFVLVACAVAVAIVYYVHRVRHA